LVWLLLPAPARADLVAPSPAGVVGPCADPLAFDCYPLIGRDVVAVPRPRLELIPDFTLHEVELISVGNAPAQHELLSGDAIVPRIRTGGFRKFPPPILTGVYAVGYRPFRLSARADRWTFRVEGGTLIAVRDGKTRLRRRLHAGGFECYEHTPWVVKLWLDPSLDLLVMAAWGDKCVSGGPSWEVISL
jgi:hypothetical protein